MTPGEVSEVRSQVTAAVTATIDRHGPVLVSRGDVGLVMDAMVTMYADTLAAVCRVTRYGQSDRQLAEASDRLPVLAGGLLLAELRRRYPSRTVELDLLLDVLFVLILRGDGTASEMVRSRNPLTATLCSRIEETAVGIVRSVQPAPGALNVEQTTLILSIRPVLDRAETIRQRKAQLQETRKLVGSAFTITALCDRVNASRAQFYSRWLGIGKQLELWRDSSDEALKVWIELASPAETWEPPRKRIRPAKGNAVKASGKQVARDRNTRYDRSRGMIES